MINFSQIFDRLREKDPKFFRKLIPIEVDYSRNDLNINLVQLETIQKEVEVRHLYRKP